MEDKSLKQVVADLIKALVQERKKSLLTIVILTMLAVKIASYCGNGKRGRTGMEVVERFLLDRINSLGYALAIN